MSKKGLRASVFLCLTLACAAPVPRKPAEGLPPIDFLPSIPSESSPNLTDLLSAPVLDRAFVVALAQKREDDTRSSLKERVVRLAITVCSSSDHPVAVEGYRQELLRQNGLYKSLSKKHGEQLKRRLRTELAEKDQPRAMGLLATALGLAEERQRLVERYFTGELHRLESKKACPGVPGPLPQERLVLPLIVSWFELARILPPEKRFAVFRGR